ncbi:PEP-CTERM sorting domain-containing protein [Allorhodopirellula solitaria]|uniref:Ice-binding protein C-terminal domain-containing protein n=1 Tax=Allorhodopirellula solitaria TaxID=2527987 RepID=A0A5C5XR15_9BACT|nr:PEP-CTERM sorting domain-containing protein [Allorhodopirellula solitaria]TWT65344.1 hypothetical protein CA85_32560 [Allorhodopirellula solitaria]
MKTFLSFNGPAVVLAGLCVVALTGVGHAGVINPEFEEFGALPAATFGGSGIDNSSVAVDRYASSYFNIENSRVTLGLSATPRFSQPALSNDGAGTFSAVTGAYSPSEPNTARWNVSFYISQEARFFPELYGYQLLYDFDPAADTDEDDLGRFDLTAFALGQNPFQGSENVGFGYLTINAPPLNTVPAYAPFDPNVRGEYTFSLVATNISGDEVARSTIIVNTVPEPATLAMFSLLTIGAAGAYRRRRKNRAAAC